MNGGMSGGNDCGQVCNHEWTNRPAGGVQCKRCGLIGAGTALVAQSLGPKPSCRHQWFTSIIGTVCGICGEQGPVEVTAQGLVAVPEKDGIPHIHDFETRKAVSPTSVERICRTCGRVRGLECRHWFKRLVNHEAIGCTSCGLIIPQLTLLACAHHFTNLLNPNEWMCDKCHAPKSAVDQLCYAEPGPSNMMRDLGNAPKATVPYAGLSKWLPQRDDGELRHYAGVDLSKVSMDPLGNRQRIADPGPLVQAIEKMWQKELDRIHGPPVQIPPPNPPGGVAPPRMTDPAIGPLPVPNGPTISYDEYREYRHGQAESGPGIEKLPVRPEPDTSSEMSDWDLLPDA